MDSTAEGAYSASSASPAQQQSRHREELHMSDRLHMSPQDYAPRIKVEQAHPSATAASVARTHPLPHTHAHYQPSSAVPNILQPGGLTARPPAISANTAPAVPTAQPDEREHSRPSFSMSHSYSRSSPSGAYDSASAYQPYTPTTPGGSASMASQFMSPSDVSSKYGSSSGTRQFSNTPLGLADIRPRADSSMSDGAPGTLGYDLAHAQAGTSNYMAPWPIYAFDWCKWRPQGNSAGKLAVGSYLEDGHNFIQILDSHATTTPQDVYAPGNSKYTLEFNKIAEATHSYPVTRLLWEPPSSQKQSTDLLATSGDHLRLWSLPSETPSTPGSNIGRRGQDGPATKLTPLALLSNSKTPDHTAPLTSLDWNTMNPALIITSSIDTTCTIWDIPSLTAKTQLIAHDKEVYDVRFCANTVDVFVSCGQDGSVRMFDLRSLEHSTIIYEPTGKDDRAQRLLSSQAPTRPLCYVLQRLPMIPTSLPPLLKTQTPSAYSTPDNLARRCLSCAATAVRSTVWTGHHCDEVFLRPEEMIAKFYFGIY
ncbi:putative WD repeat-containing protein-like protein [Emericellopsis cladophorae]|uniref:WD repeat-containing protein-like protein n=1 Tax=Emericellopsis cladophorae TaxID=2686198 RepID=A0A9P9Y0K0_9HYPO|nr:putative WD repeat-containing protein-like protein [Emericellopsis cladophorae]KAI6781287.1 putative WD repeat-containing protein-like protein [Emericellopsis cladophorae]